MFSDPKVQSVFEEYETRAKREKDLMGREGFEGRDKCLLPVGLDVGRFLHSLILARKPKRILEVGTSYGYSTLFLADAARTINAKVITLELADYKQDHAKDKLHTAGLSGHLDFRLGDAVELIDADPGPFDFVLLDIWKSLYVPCFTALYPKLSDEGIIAADNMYYPAGTLEYTRLYRETVLTKSDLQTTLLSIGSGVELTCKWPDNSMKL
ncbi:MAG TPA: methyltransferase [Rhodobacteraceae bacterium]|jgi:predicted O-methyltransferase YrrM|nr:class I SAM-dependent methyltransferase [Hellea sp.]HAB37247.1 methyltransferase [Paracoccaceae bacterium]HAU83682.1 methyltransferase [Betaproteobacteria bacterium]MDA8888577.1 class I SAM-dependent methyltransferase [Hellea sp.]MDA8996753.1 class I SAM-dependent methyltransferase [Hellea sp.]MDB4844987.1 class I SAM-dependent methyltransferase [Hellea sp.]